MLSQGLVYLFFHQMFPGRNHHFVHVILAQLCKTTKKKEKHAVVNKEQHCFGL